LCHPFGTSLKTGYKLLARFATEGGEGLADRSRRPKTSPRRTAEPLEVAVLALRDRHPAWGVHKLRARWQAQGLANIPSPSTITAILRRHGRRDPAESAKHTA
jgi:transposase